MCLHTAVNVLFGLPHSLRTRITQLTVCFKDIKTMLHWAEIHVGLLLLADQTVNLTPQTTQLFLLSTQTQQLTMSAHQLSFCNLHHNNYYNRFQLLYRLVSPPVENGFCWCKVVLPGLQPAHSDYVQDIGVLKVLATLTPYHSES